MRTETIEQLVIEHLKNLDEVLKSTKGYTDESKYIRGYIVGQIEALQWILFKIDKPSILMPKGKDLK